VFFLLLLIRRAVAVELEVTEELNRLLCSVEAIYKHIVREVAVYAVVNNVLSATRLQRLFYRKYRGEYPVLHAHLIIQAIRQASEVAESFVKRRMRSLVSKPYPEVRSVSIRFTEKAWSYEQFIRSIAPVRLELSLSGGRTEVWIKPHKRFWLYWWKVLSGEAGLGRTLIVKRRTNKWYAIFVFELKPRVMKPQLIIAFDINENTVAVSRIDIIATIDKTTSWNRQYATPQLYTIRTDFGRLAKRYKTIRNKIIDRLKPGFALPSGNYVNVANTREFRKRVKHLREKDRKLGRVRQIANELTKTPAIIVTEELGEKPQESMINEIKGNETRHRIKQTPFKAVEEAVEDKALERGSKLFHVSSYRNSRVCPIHFTRLGETNDWHILKCPLGHYVNRDYASVVNMMWKTTPEAWAKGVWWDLRKRMDWEEREGNSNPFVPNEIVKHIHAVLKTFTASEQSPAMLARGHSHEPSQRSQ
jgi:IS605 OrfB family transposase